MKTNLKEVLSKKMSHLFVAAIMVCLFFGLNTMKVNASDYFWGDVYNLTQTQTTATSATVQWTADADCAKFKVYVKNSANYNADYTYVATTQSKSYTINNLASGSEYYIKVEALSASNQVGYSDYISDAITLPTNVKNLIQERWYYFAQILYIDWADIDSATGYQVQLINSKGKVVKSLNQQYSGASFGSMKDEVYTVNVRAYTTFNGKTYYTPWSKIYCFNQARIKSVKVSSKKLKVTWGKVGGATGYDIYVSTKKKSGYKKVKSVGKNTTKATISKFNKKSFSTKKTYYIYVITKKKMGSKTYLSSSLYYWNSKSSGFGYK